MTLELFKKTKKTAKELAGSPAYGQTIEAIKENKNWFIINTQVLNCEIVKTNQKLNDRVNAFKLCLQTFGPNSKLLPDLRNNQGEHVKNKVFHGHVSDSNGVVYVLEWAVIDPKERIISLINFDKHENYAFRQKALSDDEKHALILDPKNQKILARAKAVVSEIIEKIQRTEENYRFC